ncbi:hypothetical protein [Streptomyces acidiscabies]|uniref:hypothetical protein n=1 Tax=Streptomyces acidiscabies TaxID=42234 RepID=UPI00117C0F70|nr:hypothetical protein [Streptomyces acidiscabies]
MTRYSRHARIRAGAPEAFQALYVRDAPSSSAAGSARFNSSGFTVDGTFKAGNTATGRVAITPTAANTSPRSLSPA